MGQTPNASMHPVARRRSQRVLMQVAVRIRGEDAQGKSIEEETETLAINAHGALVLMKARLTSGSKVFLQHKRTQEEQECMWPSSAGAHRQSGNWAGIFVAAARILARGVSSEDWTPRHPEARTVANHRSGKS